MGTTTRYLIYGLHCPITNNLHYVGKSTSYLTRPMQHMSASHSDKIREWVGQLKEFGQAPIIRVIEYVEYPEDLDEREKYWIYKSLEDGCYLLNKQHNTVKDLITAKLDAKTAYEDNSYKIISNFVRGKRKQFGLSQPELAQKSGVGLRLLREIEQGKKCTLRMDKVNQVLQMFGVELSIKVKDRI